MAASDSLQLAQAVRAACVKAALDGYERAQVAGLCREGAWECAVDAVRLLDLKAILEAIEEPPASPHPRGPSSA